MKTIFTLGVSLLLAVSARVAVAVPLIDTTNDTPSLVLSFGEPSAATFGQTFTVTGPETQLNSFSFRLNDARNPDLVDFAAYVYAWNGSNIIGSALYRSEPLSSSNNGGADGYEIFSFNTGGIPLAASAKYAAFLSASLFFDGESGLSAWPFSDTDVYAGGNFIYANNESNFADLFSPWDCGDGCFGGRDTAFTATFSAPSGVPEPTSLALIAIGLAASGLHRSRKAL